MKKLFYSILSAALFTTAIPSVSLCALGQDRGGGDDVAIEFQTAFNSAIRSAPKQISQQFSASDLKQRLSVAKIVGVSTVLKVTIDGVSQESVATNSRNSQLIEVNRDRWMQIRNWHIKEAIALHEMLSLQGLESSGKYPISSQYLMVSHISSGVIESASLSSKYEPVFGGAADQAKAKAQLNANCKNLNGMVRDIRAIIAEARFEMETTRDLLLSRDTLDQAGSILHQYGLCTQGGATYLEIMGDLGRAGQFIGQGGN